MEKIVLFQLCIIIPMAAGFLTRNFFADPPSVAKRIIGINLLAFEPVIAFWTLWGLTLHICQAVLPLCGLAISFTGLAIGAVISYIMKLRRKRRATFLISSSLSNHGATMGGFVCYLLLGEQGLALSFLFILYFMPYVLLAMFPYASRSASAEKGPVLRYSDYILDKRNTPLLGIVLALVCKVAGIQRPALPIPIDLFVVLSVSLYYYTLGITAQIGNLRSEMTALASLSLIKFILIPLITISALNYLDLNPVVRAVIFLQSCMPVAVYSVITAVLFDLDIDMASKLFILNTALFMGCVLPMILLFKEYIL